MASSGSYAEAIAAIDDRESLLENAFDLLTDGIALLSRDGRIVYLNETLRRLAECGNDFRIGRNTIEFSEPDLRGRFASAVDRVHAPAASALARTSPCRGRAACHPTQCRSGPSRAPEPEAVIPTRSRCC